ncbi:unnamed protein product [Vicia faba]|uniref:Tf2-1-like SH3-like domain-containing protein n=1 Tax=Vicia faba TaxID=3906 RepID=A0AAV1A8L5_VICFA|nr:unnamed protein product [Vicia faba]
MTLYFWGGVLLKKGSYFLDRPSNKGNYDDETPCFSLSKSLGRVALRTMRRAASAFEWNLAREKGIPRPGVDWKKSKVIGLLNRNGDGSSGFKSPSLNWLDLYWPHPPLGKGELGWVRQGVRLDKIIRDARGLVTWESVVVLGGPVHLRKERFPRGQFAKLKPRADGPFKVIKRIGENAYKIELPAEYEVSDTLKVSDLFPYYGEESTNDSGASLLQLEGEN